MKLIQNLAIFLTVLTSLATLYSCEKESTATPATSSVNESKTTMLTGINITHREAANLLLSDFKKNSKTVGVPSVDQTTIDYYTNLLNISNPFSVSEVQTIVGHAVYAAENGISTILSNSTLSVGAKALITEIHDIAYIVQLASDARFIGLSSDEQSIVDDINTFRHDLENGLIDLDLYGGDKYLGMTDAMSMMMSSFVAGAVSGAIIGSIFGPGGAAIGGFIGGVIGTIVGIFVVKKKGGKK